MSEVGEPNESRSEAPRERKKCRCGLWITRGPQGAGWIDDFGSWACGGVIDGGPHAPRELS